MGLEGIRLLVLGESHYGAEPSTKASSDLTERLMRGEVQRGSTKTFLTKTSRLLLRDQDAGKADRRKVRDQIAFYNFVQSWAGTGARIAPTDAAWAKSRAPFREVMNELEPHAVLVLGKRLWKHIPVEDRESGPFKGAECVGMGGYSLDGGKSSFMLGVHHPSSAFRYARWTPAIEALLKHSS